MALQCVRSTLRQLEAATEEQLALTVQHGLHELHGRLDEEGWRTAQNVLQGVADFELQRVKDISKNEILKCIRHYEQLLVLLEKEEKETRHPAPRVLGETWECLYVEKPPNFTCNYGAGEVPPRMGAESGQQLLNASKKLQIHEYVALDFEHETARATRESWKEKGHERLNEWCCSCQSCTACASQCAGCCNRLDKETSGVMIVAKTFRSFWDVRRQFMTDHTLRAGGPDSWAQTYDISSWQLI